MKKILFAALGTVSVVLVILAVFTIQAKTVRQKEINSALTASMENALMLLMYPEQKPESEEVWMTMFLQNLAGSIDTNSTLDVKLLEADMQRGILSVEATLRFRYPFGAPGSVSSTQTMILEEYMTEPDAG